MSDVVCTGRDASLVMGCKPSWGLCGIGPSVALDCTSEEAEFPFSDSYLVIRIGFDLHCAVDDVCCHELREKLHVVASGSGVVADHVSVSGSVSSVLVTVDRVVDSWVVSMIALGASAIDWGLECSGTAMPVRVDVVSAACCSWDVGTNISSLIFDHVSVDPIVHGNVVSAWASLYVHNDDVDSD